MRGEAVGVGLTLDGGGVVGMAIVVVCGDEVARDGPLAHADARRTRAMAKAGGPGGAKPPRLFKRGPRATPQAPPVAWVAR